MSSITEELATLGGSQSGSLVPDSLMLLEVLQQGGNRLFGLSY